MTALFQTRRDKARTIGRLCTKRSGLHVTSADRVRAVGKEKEGVSLLE